MTDQALEAIKLTSKEDRELLHRVRQWVEERKADLEDYEPCCVLVSRLVKCFRTNELVACATDGKNSLTPLSQQHSTMNRKKEVTSVGSTAQVNLDKSIIPLDCNNSDQRKHSSSNQNEEPRTKTGAKIDGIRNISNSKISPMVERDNLFLLLNDFAQYLSLVQRPSMVDEEDDEGQSKLTVADVATQVLVYLTEESITTNDLYINVVLDEEERKLSISTPKELTVQQIRAGIYGSDSPANHEDFVSSTTNASKVHRGFRSFVFQVLRTLQLDAVSSVESFHDFEYLWDSCQVRAEFAQSVTNLLGDSFPHESTNDNGKRPRDQVECRVLTPMEAKECAWKLSCLQSQTINLNNTNQSQERDSNTNIIRINRRQRLLISAAAMSLLASLDPVVIHDKETIDTTNIKHGHRQILPMDNELAETTDTTNPSIVQNHSITTILDEGSESITTQDIPTTSGEADAIAALSMIFSAPQPIDLSPAPDCIQGKDAVDIAVEAANALHSFLSMANLQDDLGESFTRKEMEDTIVSIAKTSPIVSLPRFDGKVIEMASKSCDCSTQSNDNSHLAKLGHFTSENLLDEALDKLHKKWGNNQFDAYLGLRLVAMVDDVSLTRDQNLLKHVCFASKKYKACYDKSTRFVSFIHVFDPDDPRNSISTEPHVTGAVAALKASRSHGEEYIPKSTVQMIETLQLNEWCVAIMSAKEVKPSQRLLLYLEASDDDVVKQSEANSLISGVHEDRDTVGWRSKIVTILNRGIYRLTNEGTIDTPNRNKKFVVDSKTGELTFDSVRASDPDAQLCVALVTFFYHALECTIFQETLRQNTASHPKLIQNDVFHRALLSFCYVCILKGFSGSGKLPLSDRHQGLQLYQILQLLESTPYSYLKTSESVARALRFDKGRPRTSLPHTSSLPTVLERHLSLCEIIILDSHIWSRDENLTFEGCVMDAIREIKLLPPTSTSGYSWPPEELQPTLPDEKDDYFEPNRGQKSGKHQKSASTVKIAMDPEHQFTMYAVRKLLKIMYFRIAGLCNALHIPDNYPIAGQIWIALRYLLRHHIELLYDRHIDQLLLCVLYGVSKIIRYDPELSFSRIIDGYFELRSREIGDHGCQRVVKQIRIVGHADIGKAPNDKQVHGNGFGNVIHLYNQVFVPVMKNHLLQSKSLKKASLKLRRLVMDKCDSEAMHAEDNHGNLKAPLLDGTGTQSGPPIFNLRTGSSSSHSPAIPPLSLPSAIQLQKGNITLNIRLGTTAGAAVLARVGTTPVTELQIKTKFSAIATVCDPNLAFVAVTSPACAKVRARALFTFGNTNMKDIERANRMVTKW